LVVIAPAAAQAAAAIADPLLLAFLSCISKKGRVSVSTSLFPNANANRAKKGKAETKRKTHVAVQHALEISRSDAEPLSVVYAEDLHLFVVLQAGQEFGVL